MAIAPNTTFVSGAVLTAAQQNAFGFGVVAYQSATSNTTTTTEAVVITSTSFTAIANRYYKITYVEPEIKSSVATTYLQVRIRKGTTTAGTVVGGAVVMNSTFPPQFGSVTCVAITTLTAGAQQLCATAESGSGTATLVRSATAPAFILVEDIGPA